MSCQWSALPIELTVHILTLFGPTELVNFRRVNSFFKSLIDETTTFQYRIALFASGMVDGPPGGLTPFERLELLRSYEASWKNIEWSEHNTIHYPQGLAWEFYGNVWAHSRGSDAIEFVQLPSLLRGIPMRQWTLTFDFAVRDFSMDPSQDLLVTIENNFRNVPNLCRIQMRTLSTGEKHPLAGSTATMEYTLALPELGSVWWSYSIRICGDHVGILFIEHYFGGRNELVVWSWRTGFQKLVVLSARVQSFTFLGDSFILGSTSAPPALLVYSLEQRPADDWDTTQASAHLLRFLFGSHFQGPHGTSTILLASDPSPGWLPSAGQVPFQIAGDERMVAIYSQFFDNWEDEIFLIPTKTLLGQIESLPIEEGFDVEWELYGPQLIERVPEHSRWDDLWPYFVFGMRCILPKVVHLDDKPMVIIRDLSPRRCLRASKEERKESDALYHAITWTPRRTPYPRSILKCAPLPESITLHWSTLLISEDGIVVVENGNAVGGPAVLHLLTF